MKNIDLTGCGTALITPFRNGEVDYDAFAALVDRQVAAGIDFLVPLGTTGETPCLEDDERIKVLQTAKEHGGGLPILVGGGTNPQPGEISLAHNGVLFLDELPEFKRAVLEVLRQPLEDRKITVSRTKMTVDYPASFMLVASMNPCPCGYYNDPNHECTCAPGVVQRYLSRISGPLLDRIDMHIEIVPVPFSQLAEARPTESSAAIRARVIEARNIQTERFKDEEGVYCNAQMNSKLIRKYCQLDAKGQDLLNKAMTKHNLSARAYDRILKMSRTIADLDNSENIQFSHVAEAINYRNLDKESWALK